MLDKSILDDILTLGHDVFNGLRDARHDLKAEARKHAGTALRKLDLVSREEFDAAFAMLAKARDMQEDLADRLSKIEQHLKLSNSVKTKKPNLRIVKTKRAHRTRK